MDLNETQKLILSLATALPDYALSTAPTIIKSLRANLIKSYTEAEITGELIDLLTAILQKKGIANNIPSLEVLQLLVSAGKNGWSCGKKTQLVPCDEPSDEKGNKN